MSIKIHFNDLIKVKTEDEAVDIMDKEFEKVSHIRCASVTKYFWVEEINDGWEIKTTYFQNYFQPIEVIFD